MKGAGRPDSCNAPERKAVPRHRRSKKLLLPCVVRNSTSYMSLHMGCAYCLAARCAAGLLLSICTSDHVGGTAIKCFSSGGNEYHHSCWKSYLNQQTACVHRLNSFRSFRTASRLRCHAEDEAVRTKPRLPRPDSPERSP